MSDLVDLEDLLDGMVGDDHGFDEVEWAVKEIGRLRVLLGESQDESAARWAEIIALKQRIEKLENAVKETLNYRGEIIDRVIAGEHLEFISHDQINAAWMMVNDEGLTPVAREMALRCLKKLGIERCSGCEGEGKSIVQEPRGAPCPNCNGKGWVKKGDGASADV